MPTAAVVDALLLKFEKSLAAAEKNKGSMVKMSRIETDLLANCGDFRDCLQTFMRDSGDAARAELVEVFGGDCVRLAKAQAFLANTKLSEKNSADARLSDCVTAVDIIERLLREKNLGAKIDEAKATNFCAWEADHATVQAPAPAPAKAPALGPAPAAPEPTPAAPQASPAAPEPAPAATEPAPAATDAVAGGKLVTMTAAAPTEECVSLTEGQEADLGADEAPRMITAELRAAINPEFEINADGSYTIVLPCIDISVGVVVEPPLPTIQGIKPVEPLQEFKLVVPGCEKVVYDPAKALPAGGVFKATVKKHIEVVEVPGSVEAKVAARAMAPWGCENFATEKGDTSIHYAVQVASAFGITAGTGKQVVEAELTYTVEYQISGVDSTKYTADGSEMPPLKR